MYTFCFICKKCKTTYFNKRIEIFLAKRTAKKESVVMTKAKYKKLTKNLYYAKKFTGVDDIIQRMRDSVEMIESGIVSRQVLIRIFEINFRKNKYKNPHNYSPSEVLSVMREMASYDLMKKKWLKKRTNAELREEYNEKKLRESWKMHVDGDKCYICGKRADVRHHLIPLKNGGNNGFRNIRVLCNSCHAEVHPWLKT